MEITLAWTLFLMPLTILNLGLVAGIILQRKKLKADTQRFITLQQVMSGNRRRR